MTTEHTITPPRELVQQWRKSGPADAAANNAYELHIATQAARWGSNQELEACCEWVESEIGRKEWAAELRTARRPNPPSLKARLSKAIVEGDERQALKLLEELDDSL